MVEIDKNCQSVLRRRFENVHIYDDVKEINGSTYERGTVDIVCGRFPCQDVSIAGKRAGLAGERSGLWFEFARIIDELEPQWVVAENVPGLLSSNGGRDFATIVQWLAQRGYGVAWRILDAQYFGVPQRRRRVFIVGSLGNGCAAEVLFEREGMSGDTPQGRKTGEVSAFLPGQGAKAGSTGYQREQSPTLRGTGQVQALAPTLEANYFSKRYSNQQFFSQNGEAFPICISTGQANAEIVNDGSPSLTRAHEQPIVALGFDLAQITSKANYSNPKQGNPQPPINTAAQGMVATSRTLRSGKEGGGKGYLGLENRAMTLGGQEQYIGVRRLTPTECERLQGFPDGWTDGQSDSTRYRQLGNAVAVPVVEWIGRKLISAIK